MNQPKLDLAFVVAAAIRHFILEGNPPALAENGKFGLRVYCKEEPLVRFDPVGLSIPEHLLDESAEDSSITDLLDPGSSQYDSELAELFSATPAVELQELQDIHESIVRNNPENFKALFTDALSKFVEKHHLTLPADLMLPLNLIEPEVQAKLPLSPKKSVRKKEEISAQVKKIQYLIECRSVPTTSAIKFMGGSISLYYSRKPNLEPLSSSEIEELDQEFEGVDLSPLLSKVRKPKSERDQDRPVKERRLKSSKKAKAQESRNAGDDVNSVASKNENGSTTKSGTSIIEDSSALEKEVPSQAALPETHLEIDRLRMENRKLREFLLKYLERSNPGRDVKDSLIDILIHR